MCDSSLQIEKLYNYALARAYDYTSDFDLMILWVCLGSCKYKIQSEVYRVGRNVASPNFTSEHFLSFS